MPEGDTIFRAARVLHRALAGKTITRFESSVPALANRPVAGRVVEHVQPYGKYLFIALDNRRVLVTHMRMTGAWHVYRPSEPWRKPTWQAKVVIANEKWVAVCFNAPVVLWKTSAEAKALRASLGLDILSVDFALSDACSRMRALNDWPVGEALLHQATLAGIGNIYKSESLFVTRVHPETLVRDVTDEQLLTLITNARELMQRNLPEAVGRRVTNPNHLVKGTKRTWVYRRHRHPCYECATPIRRIMQGGTRASRITLPRSTYFCPTCQPRSRVTRRAADAFASKSRSH